MNSWKMKAKKLWFRALFIGVIFFLTGCAGSYLTINPSPGTSIKHIQTYREIAAETRQKTALVVHKGINVI